MNRRYASVEVQFKHGPRNRRLGHLEGSCHHPGVVIGATQVLDAIKEYTPQTKNRCAANDFVNAMGAIVVDARFE